MCSPAKEHFFIQRVLLPAVLIFGPLFSPFAAHSQVTLTVGDGEGIPGSQSILIQVNFTNNLKIKAAQVDVCDAGNYLALSEVDGCETTERTTEFSCSYNDQDDQEGCVKVVLFSATEGLIEEGEGPIFVLNYDIKAQAPVDTLRLRQPRRTQQHEGSHIDVPRNQPLTRARKIL